MKQMQKKEALICFKVIRAIREMNKNVTDDDVPGDALKLLDGLQLRTQLINNTHGTGRWPQDFNNVTMIALKKPKSYKMEQTLHNQPHCTYRKNNSKDTKD
jgi:hypothetical protein